MLLTGPKVRAEPENRTEFWLRRTYPRRVAAIELEYVMFLFLAAVPEHMGAYTGTALLDRRQFSEVL